MKVCPTCQRNFPDLISSCPADQSILVDGSAAAAGTKKSTTGAAAAPAPAKEKDTRTLEEKLFAPLPKRTEDSPTAAPVKAATPPPPPKAAAAPSATGKMPATGKVPVAETVFEDAPQKSSKMAALPAAED